jgi:hypothetical protein
MTQLFEHIEKVKQLHAGTLRTDCQQTFVGRECQRLEVRITRSSLPQCPIRSLVHANFLAAIANGNELAAGRKGNSFDTSVVFD